MSKEFSYALQVQGKDKSTATVSISVNTRNATTNDVLHLITQLQSIYRELENYQQVPGGTQTRSQRKGTSSMPKGTKVEKIYQAVRSSGKDAGQAARIAQSKTGQSLKTGKPPKKK
jgi:hypothetical protein